MCGGGKGWRDIKHSKSVIPFKYQRVSNERFGSFNNSIVYHRMTNLFSIDVRANGERKRIKSFFFHHSLKFG